MKSAAKVVTAAPAPRRLPKAERRKQLLESALAVVREEGADRLTLGRLAERSGVSKPVVYDHFETRSILLIELYKWIDIERVNAFRDAMISSGQGTDETVEALAKAYIECAAETNGEFHAVGAALAGSEEKAVVFQELLDNCVRMFVSVLTPHSDAKPAELERRCVGLVGAGEALAAAVIRGKCNKAQAVASFATMVRNGLRARRPGTW